MKWERDNEFQEILDKAVKHGSKAAITTAQTIAVQDMPQCYKHVCALIDRQIRKVKPRQRLSAFFLISAICRHSLKKHKLQDKYTKRWTPAIAELTGLLQGISAEQQAQVEKVLASWRKERVFSEATISSCAASLGLSSHASKAALPAALPQPSEHMQQDGAAAVTIPAPPSPANSLFSEPSAGSIDAAVLDAFPPKTVASANIEALSRPADAAMPPASHASTGSSRPPEAPSNQAPPEQYDPFQEAESYDYNPYSPAPTPGDTAQTLPPVPNVAPNDAVIQQNDASAKRPQADAAVEAVPRKKRRTFDLPHLPLPPPPAEPITMPNPIAAKTTAATAGTGDPSAATPSTTAPASRKRRSRWEDAPAAAAQDLFDHAPLQDVRDHSQPVSVNAAGLPAQHAVASIPHVNSLTIAPPPSHQLQSSGSVPPPGNSLPTASGQIQHQPSGSVPAPINNAAALPAQAPLQSSVSLPDTVSLLQPPPPPSQPPKAVSAKQNGEAQAAAALIAVEQMLQAKRHAEGRSQPTAGMSRPAQPPPPPAPTQQPPPPQSQPPLPPLPPPLAPQPALSQSPLSYPFSAAAMPLHKGQLPAVGAGPPVHGAAHMHGHPAWPHMSVPHVGHMQPHQHVHAGLQQHHVPAPMHHHPSIMQQQRWPQQQGVSHGMVPPQPPQPPQPAPPPQWGSPRQTNMGRGFQKSDSGPTRAAANGPPVRAAADGPVRMPASGAPVRVTAPQAPRWAPDAHFQDFPRNGADATPMPTDVDSAVKIRRATAPSATPPLESSAANELPSAPPSPPPGPPGSPPAPPASAPIHADQNGNAVQNGNAAQNDNVAAPMKQPAQPLAANQGSTVPHSDSTMIPEKTAGGLHDTSTVVGGTAESRSTSPLLASLPAGSAAAVVDKDPSHAADQLAGSVVAGVHDEQSDEMALSE